MVAPQHHASTHRGVKDVMGGDMDDIAKKMAQLPKSLVTFRDMRLGDVLGKKKPNVVLTVSQEDTVFTAIEKMAKVGVGALLVVDASGKPAITPRPPSEHSRVHSCDWSVVIPPSTEPAVVVGMFTERDYLSKIAVRGLSSKTTRVKDVMTKKLVFGRPDDATTGALELMTNNRFRHLPVADEKGTVTGIVSIGDIVKAVLDEYEETAQYLLNYISGPQYPA